MGKRLGFRVEDELRDWLEAKARAGRVDISVVVRQILWAKKDKEEKESREEVPA